MLNFSYSHFVFSFFVQQRQITMSAPLSIPTPMFYSVCHFRYCFMLMAKHLEVHTAVLILISQVQPLYKKSVTCVYGVCCLCRLYPTPESSSRNMTTSERNWRNRSGQNFSSLQLTLELHIPQQPLVKMDFVCSRLTFPTDLKWSYTGTISSKSLTGASCPWRGLTSWRLDYGLSLSLRKDWTMVAWPESGSSSYLKRCSILIMAYLNTLPRKLLLICALAWDFEIFYTAYSIRHVLCCITSCITKT